MGRKFYGLTKFGSEIVWVKKDLNRKFYRVKKELGRKFYRAKIIGKIWVGNFIGLKIFESEIL